MTRGADESSRDWLLRSDREVAAAQASVEHEDRRIGFEDIRPGTAFPVLDDQHGAATDRLEAAEHEQQEAQRAWLSEQ